MTASAHSFSEAYADKQVEAGGAFVRDASNPMEWKPVGHNAFAPPVSRPDGLLADGSHPNTRRAPIQFFRGVPIGTPGSIQVPGLGNVICEGTPTDFQPTADPNGEMRERQTEQDRPKGRKPRTKKEKALAEFSTIIASENQKLERIVRMTTVTFHIPMPNGKTLKMSGKYEEVIIGETVVAFGQPSDESALEIPVMEEAILVTWNDGEDKQRQLLSVGVSFESLKNRTRYLVMVTPEFLG